ncbi:MAG: tRNA (adenosine(37)-N6)-threonylcarbamoyltransferase complex dimerization subunit type 1 TsaB [Sphingobacteriales bacterium]|nr:MAG: tRNA (adenosine(37)-N6)-threonylcarbamoyltransferase complex dimerization subunit type 1 TsaB [Sphingobacteriales bacterium]
MKYILHIDTSTDVAVVAIGGDGNLLSSRVNTEARNHAAVINANIASALEEAGIQLKDLSAIALCGGPGSYTGLRIGMSTAKGLCYALGIPLLMHNRLLLMLLPYLHDNKNPHDIYSVIVPARDKEYFVASYNEKLESIVEPQHVNEGQLEELLDNSAETWLVLYDEHLKETIIVNKEHVRETAANRLDLSNWCTYIYDEYNCNRIVKMDYSEPFYLKSVYTHNKLKTN